MANHTEGTRTIQAPRAKAVVVLNDVAAYPQWAGGMRSARVLSTGPDGRVAEAEFGIDAGPIRDDYVVAYTWDTEGPGPWRVGWSLVRSTSLRALDGVYELVDLGNDTTEVTYRLSLDLAMPMPGMLRRKAERKIVDTALNGFADQVMREVQR